METIVISNVMKADVNSLQSKDAKEFKVALSRTLEEFEGKLEDFKVTKGVVTAGVDTKEACDKLLAELKSQGLNAEKKRPLEAFKDRYALKQTADENADK